jgi:hypothetical protein
VIRAPGFVGMARVLAWGAGYGAAFLVAYNYALLPDELPLSRWTVAPKSMFIALRVPLVNLSMIGLCELMTRSLSRVPGEHRLDAQRVAAALLCTAGLKAWLATKEILSLPEDSRSSAVASFIVVVVGLLLAAWFARPLLETGAVRNLRSTRFEQVLGALLLIAIALLNLPLVAPRLL